MNRIPELKQGVIYLFLILLALSTTLILLHKKSQAIHHLIVSQINSYMVNTNTTIFDLDGQVKYTLISAKVTHDDVDNTTLLEQPQATSAAKSGPPWQLSADQGKVINKGDIIYLTGHVKIDQPTGQGSEDVTLLTSELTYYPNRKFAETQAPVTITQPGLTVTGIGMTADLDKGKIDLIKQSKGEYVPSQAK
jgi:LPS export ABC transporter protein LptC